MVPQPSEIIDLTNDGSGSEDSDEGEDMEGEDRSGPLPTLGASRRSSIGLSSRRNSLGGGGGAGAGAGTGRGGGEELQPLAARKTTRARGGTPAPASPSAAAVTATPPSSASKRVTRSASKSRGEPKSAVSRRKKLAETADDLIAQIDGCLA